MSASRYCDISLPVPLDQPFTYAVPPEIGGQVQRGVRVIVPFGARKLTGVVLDVHGNAPPQTARPVARVLDAHPALDEALLGLGRWLAEYYCAPLGEVYKTMLPLTGEVRERKMVRLTEVGQEQLANRERWSNDAERDLLENLRETRLSAPYVRTKHGLKAADLVRLKRRGWVAIESELVEADPLRGHEDELLVERDSGDGPPKPNAGERWLLRYLDDHPGPQSLAVLALSRKDAVRTAKKLAAASAVRVWRDRPRRASEPSVEKSRHELSEAQATAVEAIEGALAKGEFAPFLLHGVTGSGKTEVYLRVIEAALARGKSALLLVPEIALTPAVAGQFYGRFGSEAAVLHSAFPDAERAEQWRRIRTGDIRVAIGTRSSVFAPLHELGLLIVDEEHDFSYKQDETPRYHGRDVAVKRAADLGATVVLGSATPSLETTYNAERGKYQLLSMPSRIQQRPMPETTIVDMRIEYEETKENRMLSRALHQAIEERLAAGEQAILLLNRRGYSTFVTCRKCGKNVECDNCSVTLTYHRKLSRLVCHYCDFERPKPDTCPHCGSEHIYFLGTGAEKAEDKLGELFPGARIARLDRDAARGKQKAEAIITAFRLGSYDLMVGTQMVAKGHDVPNVTLVGVINADTGLALPDFRASERAFQLLTQASGRAGRGGKPGRVFLQTVNPEHYAIQCAADHDFRRFYEREVYFRRNLSYPPFRAMAVLLIRSPKMEEALKLSSELARFLMPHPDGVHVRGPASAPVARLKREFRYQFLIRSASRRTLAALLKSARRFALDTGWPATALTIDVDPSSFL